MYHSAPRLRMCGTAASVSTLLIVVGMPKSAGLRRERRLDARVAALALDRVHQRGLFAADVRARPAVDARCRSACPLPKTFGAERRPWRRPPPRAAVMIAERLGELAADVDVAALGPDGVRRDGAALDELVRRPAHDLAVLEGAGLRLVGVADEVVRLAVVLRHEGPLEAGREAGAAAPAQARLLDLLDDRRRASSPSALRSACVAAALHPAVEGARARRRRSASRGPASPSGGSDAGIPLLVPLRGCRHPLRRHALDEVVVDHDRAWRSRRRRGTRPRSR